MWMQFLPFEEANLNPEATNYVNGVGANKVDSFGAQAWQAAVAFTQVVNAIVAKSGPNAITRSAILDGLKGETAFTANGWMGEKNLRGSLALLRHACRSKTASTSGCTRPSRARSTATPAT